MKAYDMRKQEQMLFMELILKQKNQLKGHNYIMIGIIIMGIEENS